MIEKKSFVERNCNPDEAGGMFSQRDGGVDIRCGSQRIGAVVNRRVRKSARKLRRRTWASAGWTLRTRQRWGNIINSAGRDLSAQLMREGRAYQPGFTYAKGVADGRNGFPTQNLRRHRRGFLASGSSAQRPMPHTGSKGLDSAKCLVPVVKQCCFMAGLCVKVWKKC